MRALSREGWFGALSVLALLWGAQTALAETVAGIEVPAELVNIMALEVDARSVVGTTFFEDLDRDDRLLVVGEGPLRGVTLVNFWATWCAPCKTEMPHVDAAARALKAEGLTVLSVSLDRSQQQAEAYLVENGFDQFHLAFDRRMASFRALGGRGVPYTTLLDGDGRLVASLSGITDWSSPEALGFIRLFLAD